MSNTVTAHMDVLIFYTVVQVVDYLFVFVRAVFVDRRSEEPELVSVFK